MAAGYSSGKPGMVIGPVAFHREKSLFDKIQSLEFMGLIGTTAGSAAAGYPVMCNGANLGYRRDAYLETGGFSKNIGYDSGDDHFLMAAISKKYGEHSVKFLADREAVVYTQPEDSLQGFINQRLRWVSKSRGYREPAVIGLALITYAVHLFLLAGMVAGVFFPGLLAVSLALWLAKILIEYPMVWRMAGFLDKKHLLGYYFTAQVFQLFYVVLVGMFGTILPHQWKGRRHAG
jgi:cellulose synthase/poly-beta-1,6-N-acetylglucosamine synthase-like glycosyltransferase